MGRVLGPYGVKGWIKIEPYTERPDNLARYAEWWLHLRGNWREAKVAEIAVHGARIVARVAGCADREAAARYAGAEIAVKRESLPATAPDEIYQADLIGLEVVNRSGERLGRIEAVFNNGAHEVLRVRWDGGERLLPFIANVVERVDLDAGAVRVDWGADW